MSEIIITIKDIFEGAYNLIYSGGYIAAIVIFIFGVFISIKGKKITGREEYISSKSSGSEFISTVHPPVEGTAKSFIGILFGNFLKLAGLILVVIALLALLKVYLHSKV